MSQYEIIDLTVDSSPEERASQCVAPSSALYRPAQTVREIIDVDALPDPPAQPRLPSIHEQVDRQFEGEIRDPQGDNDNLIILDGHDAFIQRSRYPPPTGSGSRQATLTGLWGSIRGRVWGTSSTRGPGTSTSETPAVDHFHYHVHHHITRPSQPSAQFEPSRSLDRRRHTHAAGVGMRDHPSFKDSSYTAPPPSLSGFTRSFTEATALVCPECGYELGRNSAIEIKRDIWVGSKCGHVYCGECAEGHKRNFARGAKAGKCVVENCGKIISGQKGMLQVFG